jgi:hypothetical protein
MKTFLEKHAEKITGTISCFDRVIFKGYLPLGRPEGMQTFLARNGLKIKDFKNLVRSASERLKEHAKAVAERHRRRYLYLSDNTRKEALARGIAEDDGVDSGLVCVLAAVEPCQSFKLAYGKGRPKIEGARRKCLCLYFYFIDREFGFLHVRIQTWFPFTVQVYVNGHEWLARKLSRHGVGYRRCDNAFLSIEDPRRAQRFADRFTGRKWPRILSRFARRVNPLLGDLLQPMDYYWVVDQAEFATDVLFSNRSALKDLYENLLKHATHCFSAEDVLTFLGRKLNGNFTGEILSDYKRRWPGARIKHRMKANWIKMYDKHGSVLRVETVINHPYEFKIRRFGIRNGERRFGWYPMAKGVANLYRYAEVAGAANARYLEALAVVEDTSAARRRLHGLAEPVRRRGRTYRGFNPAAPGDIALFAAVLRGEHAIVGLRNREVRERLFGPARDRRNVHRQSAQVSRLLKRLQLHGLLAKVPRSRRWRVTAKGQRMMSMALIFHGDWYPQALTDDAA